MHLIIIMYHHRHKIIQYIHIYIKQVEIGPVTDIRPYKSTIATKEVQVLYMAFDHAKKERKYNNPTSMISRKNTAKCV